MLPRYRLPEFPFVDAHYGGEAALPLVAIIDSEREAETNEKVGIEGPRQGKPARASGSWGR